MQDGASKKVQMASDLKLEVLGNERTNERVISPAPEAYVLVLARDISKVCMQSSGSVIDHPGPLCGSVPRLSHRSKSGFRGAIMNKIRKR
jgi:hypothetical protein